MAVRLFDQQFQVSTQERKIPPHFLRALLLAVSHLDPFESMGTREMGILWISKILNSGHPEKEQYLMASEIMRLLGRYRSLHRNPSDIQSAWIAPLLKFLSLCENFPTTSSPPQPGSIALRILLEGPRHSVFGATLLPTLASMLSPDHPLQLRRSALVVFSRFMAGWFSPQMEDVSGHHLDKLLQAVGDPFHFPPERAQDRDGDPDRVCVIGAMAEPPPPLELCLVRRYFVHRRR